MGKGPRFTNEDRIEREVRRRMKDRLASAGVNEGRIALEVLYWLPEDFCRLYMQLAEKALKIDAGVSSSLGGSVGDEGKASIAKVGGGPRKGKTAGGLHTRTPGGHASGEKGYRVYGTLGSDEALELKKEIDRKLRRVGVAIEQGLKGSRGSREQAEEEGRAKAEEGKAEEGKAANPPVASEKGLEEGAQTHGDNLRGERILRVGANGQKRCRTCGKIAKGDWVICPQPHSLG